MSFIDEYGIGLVASNSAFNFNAATAAYTLYTVPSGKMFIPAILIIRDISADMNLTVSRLVRLAL
jgi:hypothetical protein